MSERSRTNWDPPRAEATHLVYKETRAVVADALCKLVHISEETDVIDWLRKLQRGRGGCY